MNKQTQPSFYFVDTHCHLNLIVNPVFNQPLTKHHITQAADYIKQAQQAHVTKIINVGTSIIDTQNCIALTQHYQNLFVVAGIHPNDLSETWRQDFVHIQALINRAQELRIVGIGETGIDCYRSHSTLARQTDAFKAHIELALTYNLALVIHTRAAAEQTMHVLEEYKHNLKKFVIHCYPYNLDFAQQIISWGGYIGIGGPITYPNSTKLCDIVQKIDLTHILLETDAPYLPPQIIRGKQNTPAYIRTIAQEIARIKPASLEEVAHKTSQNAQRVFGFL